jgi:hypothetical protein
MIAADGDHTVVVTETGKLLRTMTTDDYATTLLPHSGNNLRSVRTCAFATFVLYDYNVIYYVSVLRDNKLSKVKAVEDLVCSTIYAKKDKACLTTIDGNLYVWENARFTRNYDCYNVRHAVLSNFHMFALIATHEVEKQVYDPLESMMSLVEAKLTEQLTTDNAALFLYYGDALNCERLKSRAIRFIKQNMKVMLMRNNISTLYQLPDEVVAEIALDPFENYVVEPQPQSTVPKRKKSKNSAGSAQTSPQVMFAEEHPLIEPLMLPKAVKEEVKYVNETDFPALGAVLSTTPKKRSRANTDTMNMEHEADPLAMMVTLPISKKISKREKRRLAEEAKKEASKPKPLPKRWNVKPLPQAIPNVGRVFEAI